MIVAQDNTKQLKIIMNTFGKNIHGDILAY